MIEPVAYLVSQEPLSSVRWLSDVKPRGVDDKQITPLYTAEQLHPRVKMTQEEFDEFKSLKALSTSVFTAINLITKTENYKYLKVSSGITNGFNDIDWQNDFVYLFINFTFSNPEETIEIVPDMKWFVVAKQPSFNGKYSVVQNLDIENVYGIYRMYEYDRISYNAYKFDTKAEAELWTNQDTEAVQLPVEDK